MPVRKRYNHERVEGIKVGRFNQGINTNFIVYRLGETIIDCGPTNQWKYVKSFLQEKPVEQLLLTHHHEDHSGNANRIAKLFSITPKAPVLGQAKLASGYKTPLLQKLVWGSPHPVETQALNEVEYLKDGSAIKAIHTPGHAKDLTVFHLPEQGYLFSGDLYIAKVLRLLRVDENLQELIHSLEKVLALDFDTVFCPHAGIIEQGKGALRAKLDNILSTCEQAQSLQKQGLGLDEICERLLGPEDMIGKVSKGNFSKTNLIQESLKVAL